MDEEGELHQYVIYEQAKPKGPKIIKLDDPKAKNAEMENYTPPTSLTVHLSKIDMPELKPRTTSQPPDKNVTKGKGKGREKEKEMEKGKPAKKDKRKEDGKKQKPSPSPPPNKLAKPSGSSSKPPSSGHPASPPIPHHSRPPPNMWAQYPSQWNQPPHQQSGALNIVTPPPPPPQLGSVVSNLMGRLDRFTKR